MSGPFVPCPLQAGCEHKHTCRATNICLESLTVRKRNP